MSPSLHVRPADHGDAEAVAALVHLAYRSEESRTGWTTEADLVGGQRTDAAMVRDLVDAPGSVVLVAGDAGTGSDGGPLVACCHLERRTHAAYLGMFAVRPGLQGRGVGRAVLDAAEAWAVRAWDVERVEITVLDQRPELIAWYERCGFARTGRDQPFPYGDERFGIPRRPGLVLLGMARPVTQPDDAARDVAGTTTTEVEHVG